MTIRHLLVRMYPKSWRDEFGVELEDILGRSPLTLFRAADVALAAVRQHLRQDPWKLCALLSVFWHGGVLVAYYSGYLALPPAILAAAATELFVPAAALWTGLRPNGTFSKALGAAAKAMGVRLALYLVYLFWRTAAGANPPVLAGHTDINWISKALIATIRVPVFVGVVGALLVALINCVRRFTYENTMGRR